MVYETFMSLFFTTWKARIEELLQLGNLQERRRDIG